MSRRCVVCELEVVVKREFTSAIESLAFSAVLCHDIQGGLLAGSSEKACTLR